MALYFAHRYREFKAKMLLEFYSHVNDILEHDEVIKLDNYTHHFCYTRLKHSMDVAYVSFFIAKLLGLDARSTARGGLLHDMFLYDCHGEDAAPNHLRTHAETALANASKITELNPVEENIIKRHMWLINLTPPRYREGFIVSFVDKFCAARELCTVAVIYANSKPTSTAMVESK